MKSSPLLRGMEDSVPQGGSEMGTDCTVIFEVTDKDSLYKFENASVLGDEGRKWPPYWDVVIVYGLPRNYDLFDVLQDKGIRGYPSYVNEYTKEYLEQYECWGEAWLPYAEYRKVIKGICENDKDRMANYDPIRKRFLKGKECRVVFRFDN